MENQDHLIITESDLASAMDGVFLDKMREFAWRGKNAKMPEVNSEELSHFHIDLRFTFPSDPDCKDPLTFSKLLSYRFHCVPLTRENTEGDHENAEENS